MESEIADPKTKKGKYQGINAGHCKREEFKFFPEKQNADKIINANRNQVGKSWPHNSIFFGKKIGKW